MGTQPTQPKGIGDRFSPKIPPDPPPWALNPPSRKALETNARRVAPEEQLRWGTQPTQPKGIGDGKISRVACAARLQRALNPPSRKALETRKQVRLGEFDRKVGTQPTQPKGIGDIIALWRLNSARVGALNPPSRKALETRWPRYSARLPFLGHSTHPAERHWRRSGARRRS